MNKTSGLILIASGLLTSFGLTGCAGYVEGDGGGVVVAEPDVYLWGGYGGGYSGDYGRRGHESRGGGAGRSGGAAASPAARSGGTSVVPSAARAGGGGRR